MARLSVADCRALGGRLVYVGEQPACEIPVGDDGAEVLALDTGLPIVGSGRPPSNTGRQAFAGLWIFAAACVALIVARARRG
jgi:hypothetical protein